MDTAADMTGEGRTAWRQRARAGSGRGRSAANLAMPSTYFTLAMREFGASAEAEAALRAGTGVTADDPGGEITFEQQLRQVHNINRLQGPGWGLRLGQCLDAATHGLVGFAAVSASTLAGAVRVIERYGHLRVPHVRFASRGDGRRFVLEIHERVSLGDEERLPLTETLMASLQRLIEMLVGGPLGEASVHFTWPAPAYAQRYAEAFHGAVHFGAPRTMLAFPLSWLWRRCATADPGMFDISIRALETLQPRRAGRRSSRPHRAFVPRPDPVPGYAARC